MLYDLTAIDERVRRDRASSPARDFTVVYHLLSFDRNEDVRVKVALAEDAASLPTVTDLWPAANWYEREAWDMFGIVFDGHPHLARILMPPTWKGHPLRKDHPARATEMGVFQMPEARAEDGGRGAALPARSAGAWRAATTTTTFMFLNLGPQHPGTHGVLRIVLQLDGEEIVNAIPDIGYHHRGAEKMGERQSWHTYIPYTDRVDYLGGVMNNLPYVLAVETLAGIEVPDRVKVIRVMLCELFRISSHLVWYGTFAQDLGALSPVFYMFTDRERALRHHRGDLRRAHAPELVPHRRRRSGSAAGLGSSGHRLLAICRPRLREYDTLVMRNRIFKMRTQGVGACTRGRGDRVGRHRPGAPRVRLRVGFPQEAPVLGLRPVRVRHPDRAARRLLRPRRRARRGDAPEPADRRAVREADAAGPVQVVASAGHAAAQGADDARHRDADHAFPERQLGPGDSRRRSARRHRGDQRQQRLLPDERRQHDARTASAFARRRSRTCRWCRS